MTFPPRFLDDLRARLTLSDIIGRRVKLTRAGREYKACCPFHKEKSPSFYINDDKQFFHCFGCGAHGDVVGFTMRHDNLSFPEAVEQLAAQAGLQVPKSSPQDAERASREKGYYALMEAVAAWFEEQLALPKSRAVMDYVTGRGLLPETIAGFRLGYAPGSDDLLLHLRARGFSDEHMLDMGIAKRREKDGGLYAFFRDRVMFPVADRSGRIIAFGGRILPEHLRPTPQNRDFKPPKYINSPETPLYHKGRTVYALSRARAAAAAGQGIVVVEGYMDVIACHQAGVRGAIAPLGTALTEEQITLLWRIIPAQDKTITMCFDGDGAGLRAAERAAERILPLLKPDHSARFAFLPDGEDPDTLVLGKGVSALTSVLEAGVPLAEYLWRMKSNARRLDRPEDRAGLDKDLDDILSRMTDPKTKFHYGQFFKQKLAEQFRPAQRPAVSKGPWRGGFMAPPAIRPMARPGMVQARGVDILLITLINHPNIFDQVDEMIGLLHIEDMGRNALRQVIINFLSAQDHVTMGDIINHIHKNNIHLVDVLNEISSDRVMIHARFARPDAEAAEVEAGFRETYHQLQRLQAAV